MKEKVEWWEYTLLTIGFSTLMVSFLFSMLQNDGLWFARSGSIGVIFGAILEYNFSYQQQLLNQDIGKKLGVWVDHPIDYTETISIRIIKTLTHFLLLISTIIWGYGDLIF